MPPKKIEGTTCACEASN